MVPATVPDEPFIVPPDSVINPPAVNVVDPPPPDVVLVLSIVIKDVAPVEPILPSIVT